MTQTMETISELAARWAVRADAGALGPDEQRELETWLAADSRHRGAYVRARAQWVDLDRLAALQGPAGGTAFAVRLDAAQVDVTVTEGVVEVVDLKTMSGLGPATTPVSRFEVKRVAAHEHAVIARSRAPEVEPIAPAKADRQLAWREGMGSFDGETLQTAVAEINRHNRRQIVVDDPALAAMPIVGVFRATDLEGFSAAAAAALKAQAIPDGDVIRLQLELF